MVASFINFAKVHVHVGKIPEVFGGDNLHYPIWLNANNKVAPTNGLINLTIHTIPPKSTDIESTKSMIQVDGNNYSNPVNLDVLCAHRGKVQLSRVTIESLYPLGLYRCWTHLAFLHDIVVFPKPIPCEIVLHLDKQSASGEQSHANLSVGHDEFSHLKNYQKGEPLNHVAWKQLARGRGMVSKQFSSLNNQIGWIILNNTYSNNSTTPNEQLELELGKLCYQVIELSRKNITFGMSLGSTSIAPNSGHEHRLTCLTALALYGER